MVDSVRQSAYLPSEHATLVFAILDWLRRSDIRSVTQSEIWIHCERHLRTPVLHPHQLATQIGIALKRNGWQKVRISRDGIRSYRYERS